MSSFLFTFFTVILVLLSLALVILVLMQKSNANSSMGSALGGGASEQALGANANNLLTKYTVRGSIIYFVLAFGLYIGSQYITSSNEIKSDPKMIFEDNDAQDSSVKTNGSETNESLEGSEYPVLEGTSSPLTEKTATQLESSISESEVSTSAVNPSVALPTEPATEKKTVSVEASTDSTKISNDSSPNLDTKNPPKPVAP